MAVKGDIFDQLGSDEQSSGDMFDQQYTPENSPERSSRPFRKTARITAQGLKGLPNRIPIIAGYNALTTGVREGAYKSRERVSEQAKKDLAMMDEKLAFGEELTRKERMFYDKTKALSERKNEKAAGIDTDSLINRAVKATTGIDLEPEDAIESFANIATSISPKAAIGLVQGAYKGAKNLPGLVKQLSSKEGRAAYSAARAARQTQAGWDALGKAVKGNAEKEGIINFAKQNNLTPREATLLLQSEGKIGALGFTAKRTKQFVKDVEGLKEKLGTKYNELREIGRKGGYLGSKETLPLLDELGKIKSEINLTHAMGPESAAAEKILSEAIKDIEMNGSTIEKLIATRKNLGQGVNWDKVGVKGHLKGRMKEVIAQTIEKANPEVGKALRETDKYYRQYKRFAKVLDKKQAITKIHGIPVPSGSLAFDSVLGGKVLFGMDPVTAGKYYVIKQAVQRFSTAMLTNPKFQGVHKRLMQAVLSGNTEKQRKLMVVAQKILKTEDPDLFNELDFGD
jgi:hypothetical protein